LYYSLFLFKNSLDIAIQDIYDISSIYEISEAGKGEQGRREGGGSLPVSAGLPSLI